ncbi:hypothetical protein RSC2_00415 [Bacillus paralicheniformis]|nr:hypothetical protein RSC1_02980 [Bacillus paralicheniformis]BCE08619.1 hypothetical protein RSC2_00415 [Bacillus paralicheniformis]BCE14716.1 hypothetical protein RSC3_02072 [Bacillus paralicheniformis]
MYGSANMNGSEIDLRPILGISPHAYQE